MLVQFSTYADFNMYRIYNFTTAQVTRTGVKGVNITLQLHFLSYVSTT